MENYFYWFDLLGVAVFAVSGTILAYRKQLDGFGVVVLASVTAIGGGTIRDMILDTPVFWVQDPSYLISILVASALTILCLNYRQSVPRYWLELADALGLAFFTVMGVQKALELQVPTLIAVVMGTITGCFGGMLRDVLAREMPMVLKSELYAICCIAGGIVYSQAINFGLDFYMSLAIGMFVTLSLRLLALKFKISLPVFTYKS